MSLGYGAISVGGTAASIVPANPRRERVFIQNLHATQDLYIGGDASVATTTGWKLVAAGGAVTLQGHQGAVFGIGSGAATVGRYLEES